MLRTMIVFVLLLGVGAPVAGQSMFEDWRECRPAELLDYLEEMLPEFRMMVEGLLSLMERGRLDAAAMAEYEARTAFTRWNAPDCRQAMWLRDTATDIAHLTMVSVVLWLADYGDLADDLYHKRAHPQVEAMGEVVYSFLDDVPGSDEPIPSGTNVKNLTVNDPVWDASDGEEKLVAMVVSDDDSCYNYIQWGRDMENGLAERMKNRQRFINRCM